MHSSVKSSDIDGTPKKIHLKNDGFFRNKITVLNEKHCKKFIE